jgi:DNA-binding LytR/AlgR family response regulator
MPARALSTKSMKIAIIEDEHFAQEELIRLLQKTGEDIEIVSRIESVEDAVAFLKEDPIIDLLFMDIQLADGPSFDIFDQVEVDTPVIFTTAYESYALKAFKVNSIAYLLKPIALQELKDAIEKFKHFHPSTERPLEPPPGGYKKRFMATLGDRIIHIPVEDVAYFYADDDTVFVMTAQQKKYILNYTLEQLVPLLEPASFFRLNRKYIANISAIKEINKYFSGRLLLTLTPPTPDEVLVSRARAGEFLKWVDL